MVIRIHITCKRQVGPVAQRSFRTVDTTSIENAKLFIQTYLPDVLSGFAGAVDTISIRISQVPAQVYHKFNYR